MTVRELMETDCFDVDEILLRLPAQEVKKKKEIRPLSDLVKSQRGGN